MEAGHAVRVVPGYRVRVAEPDLVDDLDDLAVVAQQLDDAGAALALIRCLGRCGSRWRSQT